jgi:FkbM family methyltransferase
MRRYLAQKLESLKNSSRAPTANHLVEGERSIFDPREIEHLSRAKGEARIRYLCESHYLGDYEILCRCLGRFKMFLDTRDVGFVPHILMDGFWEYWNTQFVVRTVTYGMTVLDIGANFGYFSLLLAHLIGDAGRLIAIEPNLPVADKLIKSLMINGFAARSTVVKAAVGSDPSGSVAFFSSIEEPKNAHIVQSEIMTDGGATVMVPTTNVDLIARQVQSVDFIKIDIEGAEVAATEGMKETISRCHPILFLEFNAARPGSESMIEKLSHWYSQEPRYVDFDANVKTIKISDLMTRDYGHDYMVVFGKFNSVSNSRLE